MNSFFEKFSAISEMNVVLDDQFFELSEFLNKLRSEHDKNRVVIGRHFFRYIDTPLRYINIFV